MPARDRQNIVMIPWQRAVAAFLAAAMFAGVTVSVAAAQTPDARAIARDGFVYGYPLVIMEVTKRIVTTATPAGTFVHMRSGPTPVFRIVVAPNGDTRYSSAWVDVSHEPQVLHVPDAGKRYFVAQVMDAWTDVIADPTTRVPHSAPGDYAIVGPQWTGSLPAGVTAVRSSTNDVWVLARTRNVAGDDPSVITAIQQQYRIVPLSHFGDPAYQAPPGVMRDPNTDTGPTPPSIVAGMSGITYFNFLATALVANPPRAADAPIVARLAAIGIVPGKALDASTIDPALSAALDAGVRDGLALVQAYDAPGVRHINGWRYTANTGRFGTDYVYRAFVALTLLAANLPEDAVYPETSVDGTGAQLSGEHRYSLHFAAGDLPPVNGFWSLTLYSPDHYLVANAIDRYTLRDTGLRRNADGSIDVAIQHDPPDGDRTNWLPAAAGPFLVTLRMYWPRQAGIDGSYRIPPIERR
jgi:DNA sulfur modification protein DndE